MKNFIFTGKPKKLFYPHSPLLYSVDRNPILNGVLRLHEHSFEIII
jgi:hypothetical protein